MENITIFKKYDRPLRGGVLKKYLIPIRGNQCECCKNTTWLNQPITLQVHHIDGDKTNNELDNLQLLCPNCHSYTDNFGSKNKITLNKISDEEFIDALYKNLTIRQALLSLHLSDAGTNYERARYLININNIIVGKENENFSPKIEKENYCKKCGKLIRWTSTYCSDCIKIVSRTVERPTREQLKEMIRTLPFIQIANQFNVSDNAIRKWCDAEKLPRTKKDINSYSDEEWEKI